MKSHLLKQSITISIVCCIFTFFKACVISNEPDFTLSVIPSVSEVIFSADGQTVTGDGTVIDPIFIVNTGNDEWEVTLKPENSWCRTELMETVFLITAAYNRNFTKPEDVTLTITTPNAPPVIILLKQDILKRNVYITGYKQYPNGIYSATYWKNGVAVDMNAGNLGSTGDNIFVTDGDVYVVGSENIEMSNNFFSAPRCWKNGEPIDLENGLTSGVATAITKNGKDLYITGALMLGEYGYNKAVYWKNGKMFTLPSVGDYAITHSISVVDGDVYIGGNDSSGAVYWKNGERFEVGNMDSHGMAIYRKKVGIMGTTTYDNNNYVPAFWYENEIFYPETAHHHGRVEDAVLVGDNVYMTGRDHTESGNRAACYWIVPVNEPENNQQFWLPGDVNSYTNGIAVSGEDIFIVGSTGGSNHRYRAVYWLNGVDYLLDSNGRANDIFIVEE